MVDGGCRDDGSAFSAEFVVGEIDCEELVVVERKTDDGGLTAAEERDEEIFVTLLGQLGELLELRAGDDGKEGDGGISSSFPGIACGIRVVAGTLEFERGEEVFLTTLGALE